MTVPSMSPIQLARRFGGGGGPICATGLPKRVTKMGFFVFRTCSRTDRQVALNFEIAIFVPWSNLGADGLRRLRRPSLVC
jgi:hypothetical protein